MGWSQQLPVLRVVPVLPVDGFREDGNESLPARGAGEDHDVIMEVVDEIGDESQAAVRFPRRFGRGREALIATDGIVHRTPVKVAERAGFEPALGY